MVVKQLQAVRPYDGSTSWKEFRGHFGRVAKVNGWTTDDDLLQHLTLALEGPAAQVLRDFDESSPTALTDLWQRIERRFGQVDGQRGAMRRFESYRQSDAESLQEFEQHLRNLHKEARPTMAMGQRDAALKRRFEDGVNSLELSQHLRLHCRKLDFTQTVERARYYAATMETTQPKKAVRFAEIPDRSIPPPIPPPAVDLTPVIDCLKSLEGCIMEKVVADKPPARSSAPLPTSPMSQRPTSPSRPPNSNFNRGGDQWTRVQIQNKLAPRSHEDEAPPASR